jgi:hypothetical protein
MVEARTNADLHKKLTGQEKKNTKWVIATGKTNKPVPDHPWKKSIQLEYLKKINKSSK